MVADDSATFPSLQMRVRVPEDVLMRQVGEEMVMLNLSRESYFGLNPVGARLMHFAESGASLGDISERLLEEFDAQREQVQGDVRRIAAELMDAGLLVQDPATGPSG
jgi:coenzyme PQQ synthesis protein D (PqqD)